MKKINLLKKVWIILLCICVLFGYKKQIGISVFEHLSIKTVL